MPVVISFKSNPSIISDGLRKETLLSPEEKPKNAIEESVKSDTPQIVQGPQGNEQRLPQAIPPRRDKKLRGLRKSYQKAATKMTFSRKQLLLSLLLMLSQQLLTVMGHPQYRQLKCATPDGQLRAGPDPAMCHIVIKDMETESPGRPAAEGDGCFSEVLDSGDDERVYCDLVCPKAHTVFISSIDQGHRACFNFYTYQLEKRDEDWYLWRSGKCLNSTISFTIGCKFDEPFRTQFPSDADVFARLRARARKALKA
uniref:DUF7808 domain-containing protein n=1 Tax=Globodera pallida TaxID=36090 RepID=A0A183BNI5_GLOPA